MKPKSRAQQRDPVTGGGGRSHQGKMLVVGAVEVEAGGLGPGRIRLSQVADYSAASLHAFLAANLGPGATAKTDGWSGYPGAAGVIHHPHVVGKMAAHIVLPWVHRIFSNLKVWALGVYHGLRRKHLSPTSMNSSSASTAGAPGMPHSDPSRHRRCAPASPLQYVDLTGSKGIRLLEKNANAAADAFLLWDKTHIDGQLVTVKGLLNRRRKERALYLTPDVHTSP